MSEYISLNIPPFMLGDTMTNDKSVSVQTREPRSDLTTSKSSLSLTSKAVISSLNFRPGVWVSPDNLLFLYRVMGELCTINKGTLASSDISTSIAPVPMVMNGFEVNI